MKRQPNPDDPAYRDQSTRRRLEEKKSKTPGEQLEKEGGYLDTGELDQEGKPLLSEKVGPDDRIIEGINEEKAKFGKRDEAIKAAGKGKKNLTDEDYLDRLKDAARIPLNILNTIRSRLETPRQVLTSVFIPDPTDFNEMSELLIDLKTAGSYATKAWRIHPVAGVGAGILGFNQRRIFGNTLERLATNIEFLGDGTLAKKLLDPSIDVPTYFAVRRTNPESLSQRMETGYKENIDRIPKKNRAPDADFTRSKVDEFARVTKHKIRKYVEKYGGSAVDLERIFKEYTTKHHSALNAKAWLNKYWKDLNKGIGQGGLKNARLKIVDGKLKIVDGRTKKTIEHPFELDHSKAKELMHELGLEGADMSDNLNIVYSEWNRAKNNIGNPAIPDEIAEAVGQSTTLENFVRRRLDEPFKLAGERVPQRFKEAAKTQMLDDAQNLKPNEKLADVIEERLKVYDDLSNFLVQVDDYIPAKVQRSFDKARDLNPQEYLQDLKDRGIYDRLTGPLKKLHDKLSDDWINLERGLRSRPTTKYMQPGHDV